MQISARNQLEGTVKSIKLGAVMAEVEIDVGGSIVVAAVTRASVEALNVEVGDTALAIVKATDVMVGKP